MLYSFFHSFKKSPKAQFHYAHAVSRKKKSKSRTIQLSNSPVIRFYRLCYSHPLRYPEIKSKNPRIYSDESSKSVQFQRPSSRSKGSGVISASIKSVPAAGEPKYPRGHISLPSSLITVIYPCELCSRKR